MNSTQAYPQFITKLLRHDLSHSESWDFIVSDNDGAYYDEILQGE